MLEEPFNSSRKVAQFLAGLQLEKYVQLFHDKNINLNIFLSLTQEDLNFIGVEKEDVDKILKYVETIRGEINYEEIIKSANEISSNEAAIALAHSVKDLTTMKTALKLMGTEMLKKDVEDEFVTDVKTASTAIQECFELYEKESKMIWNELDSYEAILINENCDPNHSVKKDKRKTIVPIFMCATAVIAIAVLILRRKL